MRLLIATPLYPPEPGGPATYAKLLEEGLPAHGIAPVVAKFSRARGLPKGIRHLVYLFKLLIQGIQADAIYALDPVSVGYPAMIAARVLHKPLFLKVVGDYAWEQGKQRYGVTAALDVFSTLPSTEVPRQVRWLQKVQRQVARYATKVVVPSSYLKRVIGAWGVPEKNIEIIHNAVEVGTIGTVPEEVKALPRPLIVSVGRMVPWKEFDGVIDAAKSIGAALAIVGDGPVYNRIVMYGKQELKDNVHFTGALSHEDTLAVIKHADVFVLNSSYEGFSHVLVEAVSLGARVVATDAGGNREIVPEGLVPVGDTPALAKAIANALQNPRPAPSDRFSKDAMLEKMAQLLTI